MLRFGWRASPPTRPPSSSPNSGTWGPDSRATPADGYDQDYEDRLFDEIEWPTDGYRLFDIGHFIGDRDWFDGIWESNCMFVPRALLEQFGGFDESFSMPGGGYANLELYERVGSTPGVTVVDDHRRGIVPPGPRGHHHQRGGRRASDGAAIAGYARHYEELRGRPFRGPGKRSTTSASMPPQAARTKARRRVAPNLFKAGTAADLDALPEKPSPLPEDLKVEFTDAFWRSLAWQRHDLAGTAASRRRRPTSSPTRS